MLQEKAKKIFESIIKKLQKIEEAGGELEAYGKVLTDTSSKLPNGKIREFFKEVETKISEAENLLPESDTDYIAVETIEKILSLLDESKTMCEDRVPQDVPSEIIKAYKKYLIGITFGFKQIVGF